jgi:hypothetical protein
MGLFVHTRDMPAAAGWPVNKTPLIESRRQIRISEPVRVEAEYLLTCLWETNLAYGAVHLVTTTFGLLLCCGYTLPNHSHKIILGFDLSNFINMG